MLIYIILPISRHLQCLMLQHSLENTAIPSTSRLSCNPRAFSPPPRQFHNLPFKQHSYPATPPTVL